MDPKIFMSTLELIRTLTVGPISMPNIEQHRTKNTAATIVLAALLTLSISIFSGGVNISLLGAGALSLITTSIIAAVGFFVSFCSRPGTSDNATEKFVSYTIISLLLTVLVYIMIGIAFIAFQGDILSPVDLLTVHYLWEYKIASMFVSLMCASISTTALYAKLYFDKKIYVRNIELITYFSTTVVISSSLFYLSHFVFFS